MKDSEFVWVTPDQVKSENRLPPIQIFFSYLIKIAGNRLAQVMFLGEICCFEASATVARAIGQFSMFGVADFVRLFVNQKNVSMQT